MLPGLNPETWLVNDLMTRAPEDIGTGVVILADVSGSMAGSKIRRLTEGLRDVWGRVRGAKLLAFNDHVRWIDGPDRIPTPDGGTNLALALQRANELFPSLVYVFSDGLPFNPQESLEEAAKCPGVVDVMFIGSDNDIVGAEFMRRLARAGGGTMVHRDLGKIAAIGGDIGKMLALPAPITL